MVQFKYEVIFYNVMVKPNQYRENGDCNWHI